MGVTMRNMIIPPLELRPLTVEESVAVVTRIGELAELRYRSRDLGNLRDPLEETVYILLSKQTGENAYKKAYLGLRQRWPRWEDLLSADPTDIESVIAAAGFGWQRATQLKSLLQAVADACENRGYPGEITLNWLADLSDAEVEAFLLTLPGVGPKTARCVMHYSLDRDVFAVDINIQRIFHRLGLVEGAGGKVDHRPYEAIVPRQHRRPLHVNLIHHGREICRPRKPKCTQCPLISFCRTGRSANWSADERPVAVEIFAGGGGMGLGFADAGYRVAAAIEWDRDAAQTYRANHPGTVVLEADARKVTAENLLQIVPSAAEPEVIVAGPPCQGYSAAGKREADDEKNSLFLEVTRLARELRPRFVVIENVPGMRGVGGVGFTKAVLHELAESGYGGEEYLLRACDFGVPQLRHRILFLAQRLDSGGIPEAPESTSCPGIRCKAGCGVTAGSKCRRPATPTVMDVLSGLPALGPGVEAEYLQTETMLLLNGSTMKHSQKVIDKISDIQPGSGPISYRRLHPDLARTIVAGHRALPVHPTLHRTLSVREAARIQGFPDGHVFCGLRGHQPLQVANAVPPALAHAVAKVLRSIVEQDASATSNDYAIVETVSEDSSASSPLLIPL